MKWSVIIPMGRPERAGNTLRSLANQSYFPESWEVLLVGVKAREVTDAFPDLPIVPVPLERNELPPKTRLIGSDHAQGDWFIFVDDDMELAPDYFQCLNSIINNDRADGEKPPAVIGARLPGVKNNFCDRLTNISNFWSQQGDLPGSRPWLYSAAIAIRANAYEKVGGFNPHLPNGEDIDLTQKLVRAGYNLLYEPSLIAYHNHGRTTPLKMLVYFWKNGNTALFFNQESLVTRCFSFKTVIIHAWNDLQNNRRLNVSQVSGFYRCFPFILINYFIFQSSIEWHYQKYLWENSQFRHLPLPQAGDQSSFQAFVHFKKNHPIIGALLYARAMIEDFRHPVRR